MYSEMYDGLRAFYAKKEGESSAPGFSAAMALSFLCNMNLISLPTICDYAISGQLRYVTWISQYKLLLVLSCVLVAWAHVVFGKHSGVYFRTGPAASLRWRRAFAIYAATTVALFILALIAGLLDYRSA